MASFRERAASTRARFGLGGDPQKTVPPSADPAKDVRAVPNEVTNGAVEPATNGQKDSRPTDGNNNAQSGCGGFDHVGGLSAAQQAKPEIDFAKETIGRVDLPPRKDTTAKQGYAYGQRWNNPKTGDARSKQTFGKKDICDKDTLTATKPVTIDLNIPPIKDWSNPEDDNGSASRKWPQPAKAVRGIGRGGKGNISSNRDAPPSGSAASSFGRTPRSGFGSGMRGRRSVTSGLNAAGDASEKGAGSHKPPEIQPVIVYNERPNLRVRNAKISRAERWASLPFNARMYKAIARVTDPQKVSPLGSFLAPLILDGYDVKAIIRPGAAPEDFLIPLMWKLSQDIADKGGLGGVKDELAAPRLVVLSGDAAACQRVYSVACGLARSSKMKVRISHFVNSSDQFSREMEDLAKGCHVLCTTFQRAHLLFDLLKVATVESVRYMVLDDMHTMVEEMSLEIVLDMFQQSDFPSAEKRQTLLLTEARDHDLETAARALLKPNCAELYEDFCCSIEEPGTSR